MEKNLEDMSSSELKQLVSSGVIPEDEEEAPEPSHVADAEPEEETVWRDPDLVRAEQAEQRTQEYQDLSDEGKLAYHGLPVPAEVAQQQKMAEFGVALNMDMLDLSERYGGNLVQKFNADLQRGRVQMPEGIEKVPNALEYVFTEYWLPGHHDDLKAEDLGKILPHQAEYGEETPQQPTPLRSRSMDVVRPDRIRPVSKPKPRVEKTFTLPDLSPSDVQEALYDWIVKKQGGKKR
jgi:hypothetical protein